MEVVLPPAPYFRSKRDCGTGADVLGDDPADEQGSGLHTLVRFLLAARFLTIVPCSTEREAQPLSFAFFFASPSCLALSEHRSCSRRKCCVISFYCYSFSVD